MIDISGMSSKDPNRRSQGRKLLVGGHALVFPVGRCSADIQGAFRPRGRSLPLDLDLSNHMLKQGGATFVDLKVEMRWEDAPCDFEQLE